MSAMECAEQDTFVIMPTAAPINLPLAPRRAEHYECFIEAALAEAAY